MVRVQARTAVAQIIEIIGNGLVSDYEPDRIVKARAGKKSIETAPFAVKSLRLNAREGLFPQLRIRDGRGSLLPVVDMQAHPRNHLDEDLRRHGPGDPWHRHQVCELQRLLCTTVGNAVNKRGAESGTVRYFQFASGA